MGAEYKVNNNIIFKFYHNENNYSNYFNGSSLFMQQLPTISTNSRQEDISIKDDRLVYEDANCKISYNFWCEGGYSGFEFHNKTDQMIKIDLSECFLSKWVC